MAYLACSGVTTCAQNSSSGTQIPTTSTQIPTTVVTVTAEPMPLEMVPASIAVVGRDSIEATQAGNAAELLREVEFLDFSQTGGLGGLSTATIRGGKPNFTLVMLDGIPVNDLTNILGGSFDLSTLALSNIEQVEIIRGPLSSVYGSDAIGGVIDFVSRRGTKTPTLNLSGDLGNFFQRQVEVSMSDTVKRLQYSLAGSYFRVGQQAGEDKYGLGDVALHSDVTLTKTQLLEFTARYDNKQTAGFPANSGGPEFAIVRTPEDDHASEIVLGVGYKGQFRPWWQYSVDADRLDSGDRNFTPAILDQLPPTLQSVPSSVSNSGFSRNRVGASTRISLGSHWSANVASTVRREAGHTIGALDGTIPASFHLQRTILQANPEVLYSSSSLTATAGVGFDKSRGLAVVPSPRVGMNYRAKWGTRFKASWAKGFKLPSLYALSNPLVGNPDLQPERSRALDVGVEQKLFSRWTFSATYFRNRFVDLIDFSPSVFRLVNRSAAGTQGAEFSAKVALAPNVQVGAYLSYIGWRLENTVEPLRGVPRWSGGTSLDYTFRKRLHAHLASQWIGRRYDFAVPLPSQATVGGYSNTNLSCSYSVRENTSAFLHVDNLLNSHYHEFIGFPSPGITIRAGFHYAFQHRDRSAAVSEPTHR